MPVIFPRKEWGAEPPDFARMKRHKIRFITLHHSGIHYEGEIPPSEHIKKLQEFSFKEKNWPDIPYHFKIDLEGNCWEGRDIAFCGETNTEYDPTGHALICLMGNYEEQIVSPQQLDAIVHLCAWLCATYNVSPALIKGHKDYTKTLCPGNDFYRYIADGTIRRRVEGLLRESKQIAKYTP